MNEPILKKIDIAKIVLLILILIAASISTTISIINFLDEPDSQTDYSLICDKYYLVQTSNSNNTSLYNGGVFYFYDDNTFRFGKPGMKEITSYGTYKLEKNSITIYDDEVSNPFHGAIVNDGDEIMINLTSLSVVTDEDAIDSYSELFFK